MNRSKDDWFYGVYRLKRGGRLFCAQRTVHGAHHIGCSESRRSWRGPAIIRQHDEALHRHNLHPQSAQKAHIRVQNEPQFQRFKNGILWSLKVTKWHHIFSDDTAMKCAASTTTSSTPGFGDDAKRHDKRTTNHPTPHRDDAAHHGAECM